MKRGTTPTLEIKLELNATDVTNVYFTFKEKVEDSDEFLLQKNYPEDATYDDEKEVFLLPLTQEDTLKLTDTYFLEAEVVIGGKSVIKSDIGKEIMQPTLYTEVISGNESNGNNETIALSFTDYIKQEGGGSSDYNDLTHKPKFNGIEWVGNKTDSDMGIATKGELQTKADKSDTYTKEETNTFLNAKQDTLADGNGVKIENDEISVDLSSGNQQLLKFLNGQLILQPFDIAYNRDIRQELANSSIPNSLASKSYVDDLMSGATKWEFVSQLPTENIDIHTIYFVPKESAETDNIYDEWVYAIQSRNPDVYDWELLGTSQVDLSNYYNKSESDNLLFGKVDKVQTINNQVTLIDSTETSEISVSNYSFLTFDTSHLEVGDELTLYFKIGNTWDSKTISLDSWYEYVFDYDAIKFKVKTLFSEETREFNYSLYNDVIRQRQYSREIGELQNSLTYKQDRITPQNPLSADVIVEGSDYQVVPATYSSDAGKFLETNANGKPVWKRESFQQEIDNDNKLSADLISTNGTTNQFLPTNGSKGKFLSYSTYPVWVNLNADNVDDTNTTNKFVSANEKQTWNAKADTSDIPTNVSELTNDSGYQTSSDVQTAISGKEDKTTISTDTTSTTVSLTLADNHEYRYTQELTSLTLTMPSGDFISSIVFASGSTPTSMTYDSNIKWSGDDITNGQFVPSEKTYNIVMWYDGINVNGVVRGV